MPQSLRTTLDPVDRVLISRACKILLLAGLVGFLLLRGVIPAFTEITNDFPEYFTSAKSVRDGSDAVKLYDGAWFREQTRRYQVGSQAIPGEFTPYPPPTALLLTPFTDFKPLTALRVVTVLNVAWLICSMFLLTSIFGWRLIDSALFILLSGWALHTGLRFGHPYILISMFCLLGYCLYRKHMPLLGGMCLGVFVPIKYYPLIVLAGFAVHRRWRVLLGGGMAIAAVALVSIGVLGWQVHQIFILDVLLNHLTGHLIPGPRFAADFQSFDSLFEQLFILDPVRNPHPWVSAPLAATVAIVGTKGVLVLAASVALMHAQGAGNRADHRNPRNSGVIDCTGVRDLRARAAVATRSTVDRLLCVRARPRAGERRSFHIRAYRIHSLPLYLPV